MVRFHGERSAPPDCGVALAKASETVHLDLSLESVMEGIWVTGTATAHITGECARCLDPISWDESVDIEELFTYPETDARGALVDAGDGDDELQVIDDTVDLESPVRDALVLGMPLAPICREDCAGLCAQCGIRLDEAPGHAHEDVDPRWAALAELRDREQ